VITNETDDFMFSSVGVACRATYKFKGKTFLTGADGVSYVHHDPVAGSPLAPHESQPFTLFYNLPNFVPHSKAYIEQNGNAGRLPCAVGGGE
jgi:hypothetical protein